MTSHQSSSSTTPTAPSPKVLDALYDAHAPQLDDLPHLLDVYAGKKVVNKQFKGQLSADGAPVPFSTPQYTSSPFGHALDTSDPTHRALAFAISGRVHNLLRGMSNDSGSGFVRSRRTSATSARSRRDSLGEEFAESPTSTPISLETDANGDSLSPTTASPVDDDDSSPAKEL